MVLRTIGPSPLEVQTNKGLSHFSRYLCNTIHIHLQYNITTVISSAILVKFWMLKLKTVHIAPLNIPTCIPLSVLQHFLNWGPPLFCGLLTTFHVLYQQIVQFSWHVRDEVKSYGRRWWAGPELEHVSLNSCNETSTKKWKSFEKQ